MNILIIAHFTGSFSETDNSRFFYLAKELSREHDVEFITSGFNHIGKKQKVSEPKNLPFKVTYLKEPGYKKNVTPQRLYSHFIWGVNLKKYLKTIKRPDVVYCAVPSLTGPRYAARYCKQKGIRFVIDIQDPWPEAFRMVVNVPVVSSLIFYPLKKSADEIYREADSICAVSQTYVDRALKVNDKCYRGTVVFLGTKLETFDQYAAKEAVLRKMGNELWLVYLGTLGTSYDLSCVFDALEILSSRGIVLPFLVMGSGPKKEAFEEYARSKKIDVRFTGYLPYDQMCAVLCECDIAVNPIVHNAPLSIINKHGDYAASGLPIVSTQENKEFRGLIEEYQMGFNCRNHDAADLAVKLEKLVYDESMRERMGRNARRCAEERFDRKQTYQLLINEILMK